MSSWTAINAGSVGATGASRAVPFPAPDPTPTPSPELAPRITDAIVSPAAGPSAGPIAVPVPAPLPSPVASPEATPILDPAPNPAAPVFGPAAIAPAANAPPKSKVSCGTCQRRFNHKNIADHRKVHRMEGDEGDDALRPCAHCSHRNKKCRVPKQPKDFNTYSCDSCLKSHKTCSFTRYGQTAFATHREKYPYRTHPALMP
ncbi:hypothetical protein ACHAPU_002402 [Fusarium lateritium]